MSFIEFLEKNKKVRNGHDHLGFSSTSSITLQENIRYETNQITSDLKKALRHPEIPHIIEISHPEVFKTSYKDKALTIKFAIERIREELTFFKFTISKTHNLNIRFKNNHIRFSVFNNFNKNSKENLYIYQQIEKEFDNLRIRLVFFDKGMEGSICMV